MFIIITSSLVSNLYYNSTTNYTASLNTVSLINYKSIGIVGKWKLNEECRGHLVNGLLSHQHNINITV